MLHDDQAERNNTWRALLFPAQNGQCPICGAMLLSGGSLSIDHVISKSHGGPDRLGNVCLTHWLCNNRKGNRIPTGCELIWLLAVNCRLGVEPMRW